MTRSQRAMRWLQPGLVVKRWLLTSGLGLLTALLGAAVWADLKPIYWILETLSWLLSTITTVLPREITGPLFKRLLARRASTRTVSLSGARAS